MSYACLRLGMNTTVGFLSECLATAAYTGLATAMSLAEKLF